MRLVVTITTEGPTASTASQRRDALREGFAAIARLWDKLYKMLRFSYGARARYGLAPRSGEPGSGRKFKGSYTEAKLKRKTNGAGVRAIGETRAFVWSGDSRAKVKSMHKIVAKAASSSRGYAENIFDVPTLNLTPKGGKIKLREEFQKVREDERANLEGLGARVYENQINKIPPKTTRVA
jgi:hypothetical protein